jgi:hypothetical protein
MNILKIQKNSIVIMSKVAKLTIFLCVAKFQLLAGEGEGGERSQIIRQRESLVLYKSCEYSLLLPIPVDRNTYSPERM